MLLHEAIVIPPFDAGGTHGCLLGAGRDLMSVQIVQAELIDQRLLDFFVEDEKAIGLDGAATKFERPRHVPVDIDRLAVEAVAGQIGNVVLAVEFPDPPHDRVQRALHHQARDIPFRQSQLVVRSRRVAKIERHLKPNHNQTAQASYSRPLRLRLD